MRKPRTNAYGPVARITALRFVKGAMLEAGIVGRPACPRGLRHGFGVGTLQALLHARRDC